MKLNYSFEIISDTGKKGESVPIFIPGSYEYSWNLTSNVPNLGVYGQPYIHLTYIQPGIISSGPFVPIPYEKVVDINLDVCPGTMLCSYSVVPLEPSSSFYYQTTALSYSVNGLYFDVYLNAAGVGYMSETLDPYIGIDPVFAASHPGYSVQVSRNIGNTPTAIAAVPEPATWATMIAGFGLVGGALRRRARSDLSGRVGQPNSVSF